MTEVNLNECEYGDILISRHGMELMYIRKTNDDRFPHRVKYPDGSFGSRTDDGQTYINRKLPEDHDIVKVIKVSEVSYELGYN